MRRAQPQLQPYRSRRLNSGVTRYAVGRDYIIVEFKSTDCYRYDYSAPGRQKVEIMKQLAAAGHGLASYISRELGANYAEKL